MRFWYAIVAFAIAAAFIFMGIAQKTFLAPDTTDFYPIETSEGVRYVVVSGSVFNMREGTGTLRVGYGVQIEQQTVAYARTSDIAAWLHDEPYDRVSYDEQFGALKVSTVSSQDYDEISAQEGYEPPDPRGSDLWIEEHTGLSASATSVKYPETVSALIATDGAAPAPKNLSISWGIETDPFLPNLFIYIGAGVLVIGLLLYVAALYYDWRSKGPRRSKKTAEEVNATVPTLTQGGSSDVSGQETALSVHGMSSARVWLSPHVRKRKRMLVDSILVVSLAVIPGTSFADTQEPTLSPDVSGTPDPNGLNQNGEFLSIVTKTQLDRIMTDISEVAQVADAEMNVEKAQSRFSGAALELRNANYQIRQKKGDEPALEGIPAGPIQLTLPQAEESWPRVITLVIEQPADPEGKPQVPLSVLLKQENPRANYQVEYAVALEPNAVVDNIAPANIGAQRLGSETTLLQIQPQALGAAYGNILLHGEQSEFAPLFDLTHDTLHAQVGAAWKTERKASIPSTASLEFDYQSRPGSEFALSVNDAGAIVWVALNETQTLRAREAGAEVSAGAIASVLSGITTSKTGVETTFGYQLVFYVPPSGEEQPIKLLGFAQGTVSAKEVQ